MGTGDWGEVGGWVGRYGEGWVGYMVDIPRYGRAAAAAPGLASILLFLLNNKRLSFSALAVFLFLSFTCWVCVKGVYRFKGGGLTLI